jgi:hypothetical protein
MKTINNNLRGVTGSRYFAAQSLADVVVIFERYENGNNQMLDRFTMAEYVEMIADGHDNEVGERVINW